MTNTPISDAAIAKFKDFTSAVAARLDAGRKNYGDVSFTMTPERLVGEIREELLDVAGWGFVLWTRLNEIEERLSRL